MLFEYKGEAYQRFYSLMQHLLATQGIKRYHIYQGKSKDKIQVFIKVSMLSVDKAEEKMEALSALLEQKLDKQWKCLPSSSLPEAYNIVTLPYQAL